MKYVYLYDDIGRLSEEKSIQPDGTVVSRKLFRYAVDEQGRLSAQVALTDQGQFMQVEFSFYDRRGLLSEGLMVTAQGGVDKNLFDALGNLVYHARYFHRRLSWIITIFSTAFRKADSMAATVIPCNAIITDMITRAIASNK